MIDCKHTRITIVHQSMLKTVASEPSVIKEIWRYKNFTNVLYLGNVGLVPSARQYEPFHDQKPPRLHNYFVQKTPPRITFRKIKVGSLGAKRLGMVFSRYFEGILEIQNQSALGNAEVPVRSTEKTKFSEPIFFLSPLAKGAAIFSSPKAI